MNLFSFHPVPPSRMEIRRRATAFAKKWEDTVDEYAEAKSLCDDFFNVFGVPRKRVATFEHHVKKLDKADGFIDLLWPGKLVVEHKSRGKNLDKAYGQAMDYLHGLKDHELPRYIIASDFARIRVHDLETKESTTVALAELPKRIELFDFISGWSAPKPLEQDPVNRKAAELMAQLHDELKASGYTGHALEHYLVRLLFCLFADDTGIFEQQVFYDFIEGHTREDGSDVGPQIAWLFDLLNTPEDQRSKNLDDRWKDFPPELQPIIKVLLEYELKLTDGFAYHTYSEHPSDLFIKLAKEIRAAVFVYSEANNE